MPKGNVSAGFPEGTPGVGAPVCAWVGLAGAEMTNGSDVGAEIIAAPGWLVCRDPLGGVGPWPLAEEARITAKPTRQSILLAKVPRSRFGTETGSTDKIEDRLIKPNIYFPHKARNWIVKRSDAFDVCADV